MYITIYAKVRINEDTYDEVMSDIGVKLGCPLSPTLFGLYINKLETYLDEINGDSLCLFDTVVGILLYSANVILLSRSGACLHKLFEQAICVLHLF
jgi:hypothetical protein